MSGKAHKTWMATDYDLENVEMYKRWAKDCNRIVVTEEVCPTTKKLHLQCRMTFTHAKRFAAVKKLNNKCKWIVAKSDCFLYEQKSDSKVRVIADNRKQGSRTDITQALEAIKGGAGKRKMWHDHGTFMVKHGKAYQEARKNLAAIKTVGETEHKGVRFKKPDLETIKKTKVIVLFGKAGIGKTVAVDQWLEGQEYLGVTDIDDLKNYDPTVHKAIVFDDFAPMNMTREQKLALFEQGKARTIRCRYENADIPPRTLKIFCLNKIWWDEEDDAFGRRTHWITEADAKEPNPEFEAYDEEEYSEGEHFQ